MDILLFFGLFNDIILIRARGLIMKAVLEDIWEKLVEIESSNIETDAKIADVEREFNELVEKINQGIEVVGDDNNSLIDYESKLDLNNFVGEIKDLNQQRDEYHKTKRKFYGIIWGGIIFLLLAIPLEYLVLNLGVLQGIILPMFAPLCNALWRRKQISEYIDAKRDYRATEEKVNKRAKSGKIYSKLLELSKEARELKSSKDKNSSTLKKLKKKFIKTLEEEMREKYREAGIDEKIEIESATITANSVNMLKLEFKEDDKKKQG